jgi:hypothetical protein
MWLTCFFRLTVRVGAASEWSTSIAPLLALSFSLSLSSLSLLASSSCSSLGTTAYFPLKMPSATLCIWQLKHSAGRPLRHSAA